MSLIGINYEYQVPTSKEYKENAFASDLNEYLER